MYLLRVWWIYPTWSQSRSLKSILISWYHPRLDFARNLASSNFQAEILYAYHLPRQLIFYLITLVTNGGRQTYQLRSSFLRNIPCIFSPWTKQTRCPCHIVTSTLIANVALVLIFQAKEWIRLRQQYCQRYGTDRESWNVVMCEYEHKETNISERCKVEIWVQSADKWKTLIFLKVLWANKKYPVTIKTEVPLVFNFISTF